jgi:hypothetical protein
MKGDGINERQKVASGSSALSTDVVLRYFSLNKYRQLLKAYARSTYHSLGEVHACLDIVFNAGEGYPGVINFELSA